MHWAFYYLLGGLAWQLYSLYGVPHISERLREKIVREWEKNEKGSRVATVAGIVLGIIFWVPVVIWTVMPKPASWNQKLSDNFRRQVLDREGMFEPKMPVAPWTCHFHPDEVMVNQLEPCSACGKQFAVVYCKQCVSIQSPTPILVCNACCAAGKGRSNVIVLEREEGVVGSQHGIEACPWCGYNVIWADDNGDETVNMKHAAPLCSVWSKMMASDDPNGYLLAALDEAKSKVCALHCLDCSEAVMSSSLLGGVTADEERTFASRHLGHKVEATMADGTTRSMTMTAAKPVESRP